MNEISVRPVSGRREQKVFLNLPWQMYADDPHWIPPLRHNQKELVGYARHPFYEHNRGQTFLAWRGGQPCGRIAAIVNYEHIRRYEEKLGFFGFFESVDDQRVAAALFDAARQWLAEQNLPIIRGPVNPSLNYECGLLVDGFDSPPTFMMTYNKPYYERLLLDYGFQLAQNLYAFDGHVDMLASLDRKLDFVINEATRRFNIKLRSLDRRKFAEDVRAFLEIYNQSLGGTWGFTPLSAAEAASMSRALRYRSCPS
jgi:hypothetical protein